MVYGIVILIALFTLPGLVVLRFTRLSAGRNVSEILGLAFGISLGVVPLIVALASILAGSIPRGLPYGIVLVATIGLILRRRIPLVPAFRWADLAVFSLLGIQFALLFVQFTKYPIFPSLPSGDFVGHFNTAEDLATGTLPIGEVVYPPGVHLIISQGIILLGGEPLVAMRQTMAVIAAVGIFLVYLVAAQLFENKSYAILAPMSYVTIGSHWVGGLLLSGLYANFVSDLLGLSLISLVIIKTKESSRWLYPLIAALGISFYITHFTSVILLLVVWIFSITVLGFSRRDAKQYVKALLAMTAPLIPISLLKFQVALSTILSILFPSPLAAGVLLYPGTPLSLLFLNIIPFLFYLEEILTSDVLFLLVLVCLPILIYKTLLRQPKNWILITYFWFLAILILSPRNPFAWRFAYASTLPVVFILTALIAFAHSLTLRLVSRHNSTRVKQLAGLATIGLFLTVFTFEGFVCCEADTYLPDLAKDSDYQSRVQLGIYDTIRWVGNNTSPGSGILALTDWRYTYTDVVAKRGWSIAYYLPPDDGYKLATELDADYVVIGRGRYPVNLGNVTSQQDLSALYANSTKFSLVRSNGTVDVYRVNLR